MDRGSARDHGFEPGPERPAARGNLANRLASPSGRGSTVALGVGAGLAVIALVVAGYVVGYNRGGGSDGGGGGGGAATTETTGGGGAPPAGLGKQAFVDKCGSCHVLAAAGTTGTSGPDLDQLKPAAEAALAQIKNGGATMPPGLASGKEAKDIADYVAKATGGG